MLRIVALYVFLQLCAVNADLTKFNVFNTHTKYAPQQNSSEYTPPPTGCRPVQLQYLIRHGNRYPSDGTMEEVETMKDKLVNLMKKNNPDGIPKWLENYVPPYKIEDESQLAPAGFASLKEFGERTRRVYNFLPAQYGPETYRFQHTYKKRTEDSATSFASGFFVSASGIQYESCPKDQSYVLRSHKICEKYQTSISDNDTAIHEHFALKTSNRMNQTLTDFLAGVGVRAAENFTVDDLIAAYDICGYEYALEGIKNQFCSFMTDKIVETLEFLEDLKDTWQDAYGYELTRAQTSPLLKNIFNSMTEFMRGESSTRAYFRFAHGGTAKPFIALLELDGKDEPIISASMTPSAQNARKFRSSRLIPYNSNVALVLHECSSSSGSTQFKVKALLNEKEVRLRGCGDSIYCDFDTLLDKFHYYLKEFDFAAQCGVQVGPHPGCGNSAARSCMP